MICHFSIYCFRSNVLCDGGFVSVFPYVNVYLRHSVKKKLIKFVVYLTRIPLIKYWNCVESKHKHYDRKLNICQILNNYTFKSSILRFVYNICINRGTHFYYLDGMFNCEHLVSDYFLDSSLNLYITKSLLHQNWKLASNLPWPVRYTLSTSLIQTSYFPHNKYMQHWYDKLTGRLFLLIICRDISSIK